MIGETMRKESDEIVMRYSKGGWGRHVVEGIIEIQSCDHKKKKGKRLSGGRERERSLKL